MKPLVLIWNIVWMYYQDKRETLKKTVNSEGILELQFIL